MSEADERGKVVRIAENHHRKMGLGWRRHILREPAAVIIHQMELAFASAKCEERALGETVLLLEYRLGLG